MPFLQGVVVCEWASPYYGGGHRSGCVYCLRVSVGILAPLCGVEEDKCCAQDLHWAADTNERQHHRQRGLWPATLQELEVVGCPWTRPKFDGARLVKDNTTQLADH